MQKTKKQYRKYIIKFQKRDLILLELDYEEVNKVSDDVDLLISDSVTNVLVKKAIHNTYSINVSEYEEYLFRLKKMLELRSRTDVLKLLLERDKKTVDTVLSLCSEYELLNIVAALAVFNDSYLHRKKELVLVVEDRKFEEFKATPVHQFFKVFYCEELDDRMHRFKQYFYFARKVFKELQKRQ